MGRGFRYRHHEDPDGRCTVRISSAALPRPGVALRLCAVIDCTRVEDRMPPVTVEFVKNQAGGAEVAGRFACSTGDFILINQLPRVEAWVAAAGLPRECARSVKEFCHRSLASAANSYYRSVAITVEADVAVDDDGREDDDEAAVPDGVATEECAICYRAYRVGGATSVKLPCGHVFHRRCMDGWTPVSRTCPYCRAPVLDDGPFLLDEDVVEYDS